MISFQWLAGLLLCAFGSVVIILLKMILNKLESLNKTLVEKGEIIARHDSEIIDHDKRIGSLEKEIFSLSKEHYMYCKNHS